MPDGTRPHPAQTAAKRSGSVQAPPPRWGRAAGLAAVLHLGVALPVVLALETAPQPTTVAGVEIAPPAEPAAEAAEPESIAEAVAAAVPELERVEAASPEDTVPTEPALGETPPAEAPLPTETAALPEPLQAMAPPEETMVAELPPPPPPMAAPAAPPPPRPARARPVQHAAQTASSPPGPAADAPAAATTPAAAPAMTAPAPRRPSAGYVGALLAALERHKDYPTSARHRRAEGVALLRFAMRRDGSVSAWRIERSTGDAELDAAVGMMVRRASPLPAPPGDLPGDPIELVVPVRFVLR